MKELISNNRSYFPAGYPVLSLLETDILEPEILIRRIASEMAEEHPEYFSGNTPQVFFKLRYTPPYTTFPELRNLILQIRKAAGFRSEFRGVVAIDVSEYKGHEEEEYFTILLKYLYDNGANCRIMFICCQYSDQELAKLYNSCIKYFPVCKEQLHIFSEKNLKRLIDSAFHEQSVTMDPSGIELLTDSLRLPDLAPYRSLQLIERLPYELKRIGSNMKKPRVFFNEKDVKEYLRDPCSSICMMTGHAMFPEKEAGNEYAF